MGIKERHEREREHVRRAILDAARELFVADGFSNVSIRKVADRIEYSPAAIYGYFPSKDDIFFALAEEGFELMHDAVGDDRDAPSALEALRRRLWAMYRFSVEHPEYFALIFLDRSVPRIRDAYDRFDRLIALKQGMAELVERAMAAGELPGGRDPRALVHIMVPPVMGVAAMRIFSRLPDTANIEHLANDVIEMTLAGVRAGLPVTFETGPLFCDADHAVHNADQNANRDADHADHNADRADQNVNRDADHADHNADRDAGRADRQSAVDTK